MKINYIVIQYILIIEVAVILLIIAATYFFRVRSAIIKAYKAAIQKDMIKYLNSLMEQNKAVTAVTFLKKWKNLEVLLEVIDNMNMENNPKWPDYRVALLNAILLPIARKYAKSKRWTKRLMAAKTFSHHVENSNDENIVDKLIQDQTPLVYFYAIVAGINCAKKSLINSAMKRIGSERRLAQSVGIQSFEKTSNQIRRYVEDCLNEDQDPYVKTACYKVLVLYPEASHSNTLNADIESKNLELALSAIRFMVRMQGKKAEAELINLLKSERWEIRSCAAKALGDLDCHDAIKSLEISLHDPAWWVRMNAAEALSKLGPKGIEVLEKQNIQTDKFAYETSQHVLDILGNK